jgi:hypothetical protein
MNRTGKMGRLCFDHAYSRLGLWVALPLAVIALNGAAVDAAIMLNAVQDTTIIERPTASQNATNDGTLLQVWNNASTNATSGRRREAIFQFDLSSVGPAFNIVAAHLEYYDTGLGDYNGSQASAFQNDTYLIRIHGSGTDDDKKVVNNLGNVAFDKDGMYEENVTYNTYNGTTVATPKTSIRTNPEWNWTEAGFPSMDLVLLADNAVGYHSAGAADAAALAALNNENANRGYVIFLSYWNGSANATGRTFGDHESGNPVRLVLEVEPVPEPAMVWLAILGGIGLLVRYRGNKCR